MKIATELAGFTLAEADMLRKAMGKKVGEIMKAQKENFLKGAKKKGIITRGQGQEALREHQELRRVRLQQIPQRGLRGPRLSDGLPQSPLSLPFHGRPADVRSRARGNGPGPEIHQRMPADGHLRPPSRHQRERFQFHGGQGRRPLRPRPRSKTSARRRPSDLIKIRKEHGKFATPFDVVANIDSRVVNRKVLESLIKAGAFDSLS